MGKIVSLESEGYQYDITNASPKDGKVEVDALSDSRDSSGYSKDDTINLKFLQDKSFMNLLESAKKVSDFSSGEFDAIVVVGGQVPVFTFKQETDLHNNKFLEFYTKGKVSAALFNGTSLLLYLKDEDDGNPLIQDKNMTCFTDEEEEDFFPTNMLARRRCLFELKMKLRNLVQNSRRQMHLNPLRQRMAIS